MSDGFRFSYDGLIHSSHARELEERLREAGLAIARLVDANANVAAANVRWASRNAALSESIARLTADNERWIKRIKVLEARCEEVIAIMEGRRADAGKR